MTNNNNDKTTDFVRDIDSFNKKTGSWIERLVFNNRIAYILVCVFLTLFFAYHVTQLRVNASYEQMMPSSHPFIKNYKVHAKDLHMLGNSVRIVVANTQGNKKIYDAHYIKMLKEINDRIFLLPGVDRSFMKSLWMSSVMWTAVTEQGFEGGPVMPLDYDGSAESLKKLEGNIQKAGITGDLVALDGGSSMIVIPLLERDSAGNELDYKAFTEQLEAIKVQYHDKGIELHITGFAKLMGDLILGIFKIFNYFLIAALIVTLVLYWYSRCWRATLIVVSCSLVGVIWQLGILRLMGYVLDPFSVLVPFLAFAIGVSHGTQMMKGTIVNLAKGFPRYLAARYTFRRLYWAGLAALLANVAGFSVLYVIKIPIIQNLALQSSMGIAALIFTNLLLIPVILSYTGVSKGSIEREVKTIDLHAGKHAISLLFSRFMEPRVAKYVLLGAALITIVGFVISRDVKIGDVSSGAPELRADSVYNQDIKYIQKHYGLSSDQFAVIVKTPEEGLTYFDTLLEMDRLEEKLRELPFVQSTVSAASLARIFTTGSFEGDPRWYTISRDSNLTGDATNNVFTNRPGFLNDSRTIAPIITYLADHKATTLSKMVTVVQEFAREHNTEKASFLLAAGNAGIEAAINEVVEWANYRMLALVYIVVFVLCLLAFRNWRAVIAAMTPLVIMTILAEALMVMLNIGLKVATLPVIALGVGIGVDYALYLLTVYLENHRQGKSTTEAYREALVSTGKSVALVGITLTVAVVTWIWSPIKFQADMGLLLSFMFFGNMIAALVILPALVIFLMPDKKLNETAIRD